MTKKELEKKLDEIEVPSNYYDLNGNQSPDTLVLNRLGSLWEVYYIEMRGEKRQEGIFATEEEACEFIYQHYLELTKRIR
jgi:hypothetical protein